MFALRIFAAAAGFTFCLLVLPTQASAQAFGGEDFWFNRVWSADRCHRIRVQQGPVSRARTSDGLILTIRVLDTPNWAFCNGDGNRSLDWNSLGFRAQWAADERQLRKGHAIVLRTRQNPECTWESGDWCGGWTYITKIDSAGMPPADRVYVMIDSDDGTHIAEFVGTRSYEW